MLMRTTMAGERPSVRSSAYRANFSATTCLGNMTTEGSSRGKKSSIWSWDGFNPLIPSFPRQKYLALIVHKSLLFQRTVISCSASSCPTPVLLATGGPSIPEGLLRWPYIRMFGRRRHLGIFKRPGTYSTCMLQFLSGSYLVRIVSRIQNRAL